jgi:hypothetical protein
MPRAISARATPRSDCTLLAWICSMMGRTLAANNHLERDRHTADGQQN